MERLTIRLKNGYVAHDANIGTRDLAHRLADYEDAEENGLLLKLPCKLGATVYVLTKCEDIPSVLDGGYFDSATGYYCPYELNNKCPYIGGEDCIEVEDKLTVFEDTVSYIGYDETGVFLNCELTHICGSLGEYIFLTKEEAEKALAERGSNGRS